MGELHMPQQAYSVSGRLVLAFAVVIGLSSAGGTRSVSASSLRRSAIVRAVRGARDSVVNIHGRKTINMDSDNVSTPNSLHQVNGMGTGIVIDDRGFIITNYHVVDGVARIQVTTSKGRTLIAQLVAHDPKTDLAIIRVDLNEPLPVIPIGTSSDLMNGEEVIAIGNAYGYEHTVTRGIISALHRPVQVSEKQKYVDLIQTDASINPGNSGGPLLNIDGEMIGINVAVRVGAQGIGFALPIDQALDVASQLMDAVVNRSLTHGLKGRSQVSSTSSQFIVTSVDAGSPAEQTGLQPGDVVTTVGDHSVHRALDFYRFFLGRQPGQEVELAIERDHEPMTVRLVLDPPRHAQPAIRSLAWERLGMKLAPMSSSAFRRINSHYRGGLRVLAVQRDSPAAAQGIRYGDILVGMHKWETISLDNVMYILDSEEFEHSQPVKFYILRGNETLYGHMLVSHN
ncbi:MAG: trypsin-like peptidase domain-containing protein [Pirellulaceae bacterium]